MPDAAEIVFVAIIRLFHNIDDVVAVILFLHEGYAVDIAENICAAEMILRAQRCWSRKKITLWSKSSRGKGRCVSAQFRSVRLPTTIIRSPIYSGESGDLVGNLGWVPLSLFWLSRRQPPCGLLSFTQAEHAQCVDELVPLGQEAQLEM